jgi:Fe-S oxidoreductase
LDAAGDGTALGEEEREEVSSLCNLCRLCYVKCPYVPPHEFALDFPRLVMRRRARKARERGVALRRRLLSTPTLLPRLARPLGPVVNFLLKKTWGRRTAALLLGLDPGLGLPPIASRTLSSLARRRPVNARGRAERGRVVLFATCFVQHHRPEVGLAALGLLEKAGFQVEVVGDGCCGMPLLESGEMEKARRRGARLLQQLARSSPAPILVPMPTCTYMLSRELPWILGEGAIPVAERVQDLSLFLLREVAPGQALRGKRVLYHAACHLRAEERGYPSRDLLRKAGAEVKVVEQCAGIDGTWGLDRAGGKLALERAGKLLARIEREGDSLLASDCLLACLQMERLAGRKASHPVEILAGRGVDQG